MKRRYTYLLFLLLIGVFLTDTIWITTAEPKVTTGDVDVKFMNYNIFWGGEKTNEVPNRDDSWLDVIKEENPDILLINEAKGWHKDYGNLLKTYQNQLNSYLRSINEEEYQWGYATNKAFSGGDDDIGNLAILSRYEITNYTQIELFPVQGCFYTVPTHYFIVAEIKIEIEPINFIGVHLKAAAGSTNRERRFCESQALINIISTLNATKPTFVLGDFNSYSPVDVADPTIAPNYTEASRVLSGSFDLEEVGTEPIELFLNASYVDAYRELHPNEKGWTYAAPNWSESWPNSFFRIDYSLVSANKANDLVSADLVTSSNALKGSDHLPLCTTYKFNSLTTTTDSNGLSNSIDSSSTQATNYTSTPAFELFFIITTLIILSKRSKQKKG